MNIEYHAKARDAFQMLVDAHTEELERLAPPYAKHSEKDFDKLSWTAKEGIKDSYEQTTKEVNQNSKVFQVLQQILAENNGFWQTSNHKYWFHQDDRNIIDRRKK